MDERISMEGQKRGIIACNCKSKNYENGGETAVKRKRGRPRKIKDPSVVDETTTTKGIRGRPKLNDLENLPSFFKLYLPKFHSNHLVIPHEFLNNFSKQIKKDFVLRNLRGNTWNVELERDENKLLLKEGWEDFVNDNTLTRGEFLVFNYNGKSKFTVEIFGINGCRKEYTNPTVFEDSSEEITRDAPEETSESSKMNHIRFSKVYTGYLYILHIPKEIFKMYDVKRPKMNHSESIVLRKLGGESQEVKICHRANTVSLNKGWREFQINNNIHKGDECEFEVFVDEGRKIKEIVLLKVRPPRIY